MTDDADPVHGRELSFAERTTWVQALVTPAAFVAYAAVVLGRARGGVLHDVAYVAPMLWSLGGVIVATIAGNVLVACVWPADCGKTDVRDREIGRFGGHVGQSLAIVGGVAAMALAMAEVAHFWIANAVYLCFVLSCLLESAAKLTAYRRGIPWC